MTSDEKAVLGRASAPAKTILFGEHAVVYGHPGIAVPIPALRAAVALSASDRSRVVSAPVKLSADLDSLPKTHPIRALWTLLSERIGPPPSPVSIRIDSNIPVAAGLGSGAALSIAIIRAYAQMMRIELTAPEISEIAFEIEKIYHGSPSGIDNSVIAHEKPLYFIKNGPIETIELGRELPILIADTGIKSETIGVVADVRKRFPANRPILEAIGAIAVEAAAAMKNDDLKKLGLLMNENQRLLRELTVSCEEIDRLVGLALNAGALGAKLTGAGRGGNIIVLAASDADRRRIGSELSEAGAPIRC